MWNFKGKINDFDGVIDRIKNEFLPFLEENTHTNLIASEIKVLRAEMGYLKRGYYPGHF